MFVHVRRRGEGAEGGEGEMGYLVIAYVDRGETHVLILILFLVHCINISLFVFYIGSPNYCVLQSGDMR